eukprot:25571-Amphidinium_carterae.1
MRGCGLVRGVGGGEAGQGRWFSRQAYRRLWSGLQGRASDGDARLCYASAGRAFIFAVENGSPMLGR